jgi:CubicO group peptidase (beta-lactamase class C family)
MDEVVQSYVPREFMGSVLVARDRVVLFNKGYGSANLEWDIPNTPSTKFRLASITKGFTAASIMLLQERGKLKVEDLVKKYIPDAPAAWDKVTIFNLLTHTSGIPDYSKFPDFPLFSTFPTTTEQLVARFRDKPLDFEPGAEGKGNYTNSGYVLLGYLIEKISGQSYEQFVRENIFTPLGMKDSGYDSTNGVIPRLAAGYVPADGGPLHARFAHPSVWHAAAGVYSTTEDLLRWEQGLFGGKLLSSSSLEKMFTPFRFNYALGHVVHTVNGRKVIEHTGLFDGFTTVLAYYPESKVIIVVLGNLNGLEQEIAGKLAALTFGETVQLNATPREIKLSRDILARYVGTYQVTPNLNLVITLKDDQLMAQFSRGEQAPIFAESETRFFINPDFRFDFVKDSTGNVTEAVVHAQGRDARGVRISK